MEIFLIILFLITGISELKGAYRIIREKKPREGLGMKLLSALTFLIGAYGLYLLMA